MRIMEQRFAGFLISSCVSTFQTSGLMDVEMITK